MTAHETCDLVDRYGTVQLKNVPYAESRGHAGLYAQIAVVVVWAIDGRLLIQQRGMNGEAPGQLDHIVGMVDSGEEPLQAALREAREESGLDLAGLHLVEQGVNAYSRYQYLYTALASGTPTAPDDGEVAWIRYMTETELRAQIREGATFCMEFYDDIEKTRPWAEAVRFGAGSSPQSLQP